MLWGEESHDIRVAPHFRFGSRLFSNDFLEAETKYKIEKLAFAATMIRPRDLPDSIVAQLVSVPAFLHSLGHERKSVTATRMSAFGGIADFDFR